MAAPTDEELSDALDALGGMVACAGCGIAMSAEGRELVTVDGEPYCQVCWGRAVAKGAGFDEAVGDLGRAAIHALSGDSTRGAAALFDAMQSLVHNHVAPTLPAETKRKLAKHRRSR